MFEARIVIIIYLVLIVLCTIPLIELKYYHDLYEYDDTISSKCYKDYDENNIDEKHTYLYQITKFLCKDSVLMEKNGDPYRMPLYEKYIRYATGPFVIIFVFFLIYGWFFYLYYDKDYVVVSLVYALIVYGVAFIIIYSFILKKITEIYKDTVIIDYYNSNVLGIKKIESELDKTIFTTLINNSSSKLLMLNDKIGDLATTVRTYLIKVIEYKDFQYTDYMIDIATKLNTFVNDYDINSMNTELKKQITDMLTIIASYWNDKKYIDILNKINKNRSIWEIIINFLRYIFGISLSDDYRISLISTITDFLYNNFLQSLNDNKKANATRIINNIIEYLRILILILPNEEFNIRLISDITNIVINNIKNRDDIKNSINKLLEYLLDLYIELVQNQTGTTPTDKKRSEQKQFETISNIEKIKSKIGTVTSFIYIYIVFMIVLLFMLHKTLKNYYIYPIIIVIYVFVIMTYYIYMALR